MAIEDPYYKWWFENTIGKMTDQVEAFVHFCIKPEHSCEFYRTLIHADVFRIVTADEAEKARWCSAEMRAEVKAKALPKSLAARWEFNLVLLGSLASGRHWKGPLLVANGTRERMKIRMMRARAS